MPEESISHLVARIGADLQALEKRITPDEAKKHKVRFPRGVLRTAQNFRSRFWFIRDGNLKRNIAYTLILSDFYRWVLNRTDLNGIAQEMMIKEGVCLVGSVCESVTRDAMHTICPKQTGYKKRTAKMVELGIITPDLQTHLDTLWDHRNGEHLFMLTEWELGKYKLRDYNVAILTLRALRDALDAHFKAQAGAADCAF